MTDLIDRKQLKFFAGLKAVKFTEHTEFHIQLDGKYQVNVYPTTGRIYIKGMNHSARVFDHVEAVDYATGDRFPSSVPGERRKKKYRAMRNDMWNRPACRFCGICKLPIANVEEATVDHKIPLSRGGSNRMDNLQLAHEQCNLDKGNSV